MSQEHFFIIFNDFGLGGVQRKIVDLVNYLNEHNEYRNLQIHLIFRKRKKFSFQSEIKKKDHLFIHYEPQPLMFKRAKRLICLFFLIFLTLRYRPKRMLFFLQHALPYAVAVKFFLFFLKTKIFYSQDNILTITNRKPYSQIVYSKSIIKFFCRFVNLIIVQTNYAKQDLIKNFHIEQKKIFVIPNWVVNNRFITVKKKEFDLIYCGRFEAQKQLDKMLLIVKLIKPKIPKIKLCLVGSGSQKRELKKKIADDNLLSNVVILPPTNHLIPLLRKAKLLILTSKFEGQPMILLESMSQAVVPVVLNYPAVEEYLRHRINGIIEKNEKDLVNSIIRLLLNKKELHRLGTNSRKEVVNRYNNSLIQKTLLLIFRNET